MIMSIIEVLDKMSMTGSFMHVSIEIDNTVHSSKL